MSAPQDEDRGRDPLAGLDLRWPGQRDVPELRTLAVGTFREAFAHAMPPAAMEALLVQRFTEARFEAELAAGDVRVVAGPAAGPLQGYAVVRAHPGPEGVRRADWELNRIYVRRARHGTGLGEALMTACVATARGLGARGLWLRVWDGNARGRAFYRRWGFAPVAEEPVLVDGAVLSHLILEKAW